MPAAREATWPACRAAERHKRTHAAWCGCAFRSACCVACSEHHDACCSLGWCTSACLLTDETVKALAMGCTTQARHTTHTCRMRKRTTCLRGAEQGERLQRAVVPPLIRPEHAKRPRRSLDPRGQTPFAVVCEETLRVHQGALALKLGPQHAVHKDTVARLPREVQAHCTGPRSASRDVRRR